MGGGKVGDVCVAALKGVTLKRFKDKHAQKWFAAGEGASSQLSVLRGSKGRDCEILVPMGMSITDGEANMIGGLSNERDRIFVAEGGLGGNLLISVLPLIHLDLKLTADVSLVGSQMLENPFC